MSAPPIPSIGHSLAAHFRLAWVRLVRGRKLWLGATAVAIVIIVTLLARYLSKDAQPADVMQGLIKWGFFTLLVFVVPFLMHAGSVAEEVEARTFGYLAGRPSGRLTLTLGKYLAGTAMTWMLLLGGLLIAYVGIFATNPGAMGEALGPTLRAAGAIALLSLYYGGLCMFWGALMPEAAGIVSTLHLAVIEFVFTWAPGALRLISMNHMARTLAGIKPGGFMPEYVPVVPAPAAVGVLVAVSVGALALCAMVVQTSEYRHGRA